MKRSIELNQGGFSLIELMIALVIFSIVVGLALPAYQNYVTTSEDGVMSANANSIQIFQEDFFLRNGTYSVGLADNAAINAAIGWSPRSGAEGFTYAIANGPAGDGSNYNVTVTNPDGRTLCITFPQRDPC